MIHRFLRYSLENEKKITAVFLEEGRIVRRNLLVTAIEEDGQLFSARLPGRKTVHEFRTEYVLTADYARGDHGELE